MAVLLLPLLSLLSLPTSADTVFAATQCHKQAESLATSAAGVKASMVATDADIDELFSFMAITTAPGELAQFVATDNVDGYYEGWTTRWRQGVGYRVRDISLLEGFVSAVGGEVLQRSGAQCEQIYPYGHSAYHDGAAESLLLHTGQRALSFRVAAATAAELAISPILPLRANDYAVTEQDGITLISPVSADVSSGWYVAMVTSTKTRRHLTPLTSVADAMPTVAGSIAFSFHSEHKQSQLILHVAFGTSAEQVLAQARDLRQTKSWQNSRKQHYTRLSGARLSTPDRDYNKALLWATASASSFVVQEFGTGIWAGLPWFRDNWGRDTFIALPGTLLVTGRFADAKAVLENFARYQHRGDQADPEYGRIPNRVAANAPTIFNTVDGTPWLLRELVEYVRYSGDLEYAKTQLPLIRRYLAGVQRHWLDASGMLTHDDADTWMDARIDNKEAWSARGNRAVEIQALWFTALQAAAVVAEQAGEAAEAALYRQRATSMQREFVRLFWQNGRIADRLRANGQADFSLRPNALMLISIPFQSFVSPNIEAQVIRQTVPRLMLPYGVLSLDAAHSNFHPRHVNEAFHHKDAAYHNGTIWGWNAGFTITALNRYGYQERAWQLSRNLATQILTLGTRGSMSELLDAAPNREGNLVPSGTYAQSWSVAEFVRNAYQDYLGFRPQLDQRRLQFVPALPSAWTSVTAELPFGVQQRLQVRIEQHGTGVRWRLQATTDPVNRLAESSDETPLEVQMDLLTPDRGRVRVSFPLWQRPRELFWDGYLAQLDGEPLAAVPVLASQRAVIGELTFAPVPHYRDNGDPGEAFSVLQGKDILKSRIRQNTPSPVENE